MKNMSETELKGMLESVAWLKVSEEWSKELEKTEAADVEEDCRV